ncbi:MAG: Branched-chain amino acid transport ATP-binding protein LivF [Frankiales bacterium]|jgi:branched-chain amino acid transport system ATP-binding protein|nr:Branched-chain amino acid transport ATP-binding protein LivF [Frankiales bacterium]
MSALEVTGLTHRFGRATVLEDVSFHVDAGEIVTLIGPNGAGKTTLLNVVSRALPLQKGSVRIADVDTSRHRQAQVVRAGCLLVPEGRQVFASMSVRDNLVLGMYTCPHSDQDDQLGRVFALFPELEPRSRQLSGTLSGGEQQMLAVGRAMVSSPRIMLLDEPSLGLSPQLVERIMGALSQLRDEGLTIVLVEQNAAAALRLADRGYLISTGRVLAEGPCDVLAEDPLVRRVYLGGAPVRSTDDLPRTAGSVTQQAPISVTDSRRPT